MTQPRCDLMRGIIINQIGFARPSQILKESRPRFMPCTVNELVKCCTEIPARAVRQQAHFGETISILHTKSHRPLLCVFRSVFFAIHDASLKSGSDPPLRKCKPSHCGSGCQLGAVPRMSHQMQAIPYEICGLAIREILDGERYIKQFFSGNY